MLKIITNKLNNKKGASAVEFAIILPILVILIFGIFEFAIAFNNYITITHAAREGVRRAAVDLDLLDQQDLKDYIKDMAYPLAISNDDIVIEFEGDEANPPLIGDPISVEITYNFGISVPFVGSWEIPLKNKAIMRLENYMN